jgi:hypothetical protein
MYLYNRQPGRQLEEYPFTPQPYGGNGLAATAFRPGGGYARTLSGLGGPGWLSECVPVPVVLTTPATIAQAVAANQKLAGLVGWGALRDQLEVNILGCARGNARLSATDFAQAVALFQRSQGMTVDGRLGSDTWTRMKALRVERDPLPRHPLSGDFDATPSASRCEASIHPAIDIDAPAGTPVPVVADGRVIYAGIVGKIGNCANAQACAAGTGTANVCNFLSYGQVVIVEHPDRGPGTQPGGPSVYTIYAHLRFRGARRVGSGEPVKAGRVIAEVGDNCVGFSTGPHLHYAVVTGPRGFRFTAGGPSRCQICANSYCLAASCPRCNFTHFWDVVTPRRPRTTAAGAGFQW